MECGEKSGDQDTNQPIFFYALGNTNNTSFKDFKIKVVRAISFKIIRQQFIKPSKDGYWVPYYVSIYSKFERTKKSI